MGQVISLNFGLVHQPPEFDYDFDFDDLEPEIREQLPENTAEVLQMFSEEDLNQQQRLKCAFDPKQLLNPGKVFPTLHRCAELGRMHIHRGQMPFPDLPRF